MAPRHIERRAGDRVDRFAEQIGARLAASAQLRPEAAANERSEALELVLRNAETAVDLGDLDGAARLEGLAATLVDDDAQRRAELLYLAAEHAALADLDRSADRELEDAATAASDANDDVDHRVKLLRARTRAMSAQDDELENARAAADDAIAASLEGERSWPLASAWSLLGLVHARRSQNGLVAEDLREAADNAAEVQLPREETTALRGAAAALLDGPVSVPDAEALCISFQERVRWDRWPNTTCAGRSRCCGRDGERSMTRVRRSPHRSPHWMSWAPPRTWRSPCIARHRSNCSRATRPRRNR